MKAGYLISLVLFTLLLACRKDGPVLEQLNLHPHGLPITILAPDSADVQEKDYNFMRDITIQKGDRFFLQIFEFAAPKQDAAGEKLRQLAAVKEDPSFIEIIKEDDQGFIFSKNVDSTTIDYDFRFVKILGEKELIFQSGLVGSFSLEDVKVMYNAVK